MQHNIKTQQVIQITAAVPYFHYNSHHHYHYLHFHYHCKMHPCRLRILLTICLLQYNLLSVSAKFGLLSSGIYFSLVLLQGFRFLRPVKGLRTRLRPPDKFQIFSLYLHLYLQLFTLTCSYLVTLSYLYLCSFYTII